MAIDVFNLCTGLGAVVRTHVGGAGSQPWFIVAQKYKYSDAEQGSVAPPTNNMLLEVNTLLPITSAVKLQGLENWIDCIR